jgi:tetratricopeptide (TPR) repeat protein
MARLAIRATTATTVATALWGTIGCTSRSLVIESEVPRAQVFLVKGNGQAHGDLGAAPVTLPEGTLPEGEANVLLLEAPGHHPRYVVVPKLPAGETRLRVSLEKVDQAWFLKQLAGGFSGALGEALGDFLELNAAILSKDTAAVRAWTTANGARYDTVAAYHLLLGHHHLVEGRLEDAAKSYRRALAIDPRSEDALSALSRLDPDRK